jgi:hypothetical protein
VNRSYLLPASHFLPATSTRLAPHLYGPADPARVSPLHLPALAHIASDLDGLDAPVKVVNAEILDRCAYCTGDTSDDRTTSDPAVATVVATDAYGFRYVEPVCVFDLPGAVRHHARRERPVVVEVPADSRRWFERGDRETWYAVDDETGVVVARDVCDTWTVWLHDTNQAPVSLVARIGVRDTESYADLRARAEVLAQATASTLAADAYELASLDAVTVALPVAAVTEVAA